jgi:hypothetical protein
LGPWSTTFTICTAVPSSTILFCQFQCQCSLSLPAITIYVII